jgi:protein CpxP
MSLKSKFFPVITLAAAIVGFSIFASAQESTTTSPEAKQEKHERKGFGKHDGFGKGMRGRHGGIMRGFRGIDLSDAQKEQLKALHESNRRPNDDAKKEMHTLMQSKRDGTITPEQTERLKALKMQAREKGKQIHEQALAILTPEQRQQLETRREEMRQKREEHRKMREQNKQAPEKPMDN